MERDLPPKISREDLEKAFKSFVTLENLSALTAGKIRKQLADHFGTTTEYMDGRAEEVKSMIDQYLTEMAHRKVESSASGDGNSSSHASPARNGDFASRPNPQATRLKEEVESDSALLKALEETPVKAEIAAKAERPVKRERAVKREPPEEPEDPEDRPRRVTRLQEDLMTKSFFLDNARSVEVRVEGLDPVFAKPRTFSTGNLGWFNTSKMRFNIAGQEVVCQVAITCTAIGSKNWRD